MRFQSPAHLWGLLLVLIPVLIHLFSFRKFKKEVISDVTLLKNIKNSGVARKNIKELLVLLLRVMVIVFLVFGFSGPNDGSVGNTKAQNYLVKIHIDNSYSMDVSNEGGELLQKAISVAESVIDQYGVNDRFQIQNNDFSFSHEKTWQKKEAKNKLAEIHLSTSVRNFESVLTRLQESDDELNEFKVVKYVISDFNYPIDTASLKQETTALNLIAVRAAEVTNIYLDSIWFSNSERSLEGFDSLKFSIVNTGGEELHDFPVTININGNSQLVTINIPKYSSSIGEFVYKVPAAQNIKGVVSIEDGMLPFDNSLFFSYNIPEKIKILVVSSSSEFIEVINNMFQNDDKVFCKITTSDLITYDMIDEYDSFVLGEIDKISMSLKAWLQKVHQVPGKQVVIVPSDQIDLLSYNNLGMELGEFELSHVDTSIVELNVVNQSSSFFRNVFKKRKIQSNLKVRMPVLQKHHPILKSKGLVIMSKVNQSSYLTKSKKITLFSSGITKKSSDFSEHPIVVPVFHKIIFSAVLTEDLYSVYGEDKTVKSKGGWSDDREIKSPDSVVFKGRIEDDVNSFLGLDVNFSMAGIYQVLIEDSLVDYLAVNQSRAESNDELSMFDDLKKLAEKSDVITLFENGSDSMSKLQEQITGKTHWKMFLILAGISLLLEMLVIKFFSSSRS